MVDVGCFAQAATLRTRQKTVYAAALDFVLVMPEHDSIPVCAGSRFLPGGLPAAAQRTLQSHHRTRRSIIAV